MYKNSMIHYVTKGLVDVMFYGGIVSVLAVPWLGKYFYLWFYNGNYPYFYSITVPFLCCSGIFAVLILFYLKKMFRTLLGGNPFVEENIRCFRKMAVFCACISVIAIVKCFLLFSPAALIIIVVFSIGTLFCLTLKDIFKQAISYKEENDLTI